MKYKKVVDSLQYGINIEQIDGFKAQLKEFAKFSQNKRLMPEKGELARDFKEVSTFSKIGMIVSSPFSLIILSACAGVSATKYIATKLRSPKVIAFLLENGVSEEKIISLASLETDEEIYEELWKNGIIPDKKGRAFSRR